MSGSSTTVCCWRTGCVGHLFWGQTKSLGWGVYFQILTGEGNIKARLGQTRQNRNDLKSWLIDGFIFDNWWQKTLLALAPKFGAIVQGGIYTLPSWTYMVPGTASTLFLGLPEPCLENRNLNFGGVFNKVVTSASIGIGINVGSMCTRFALAKNGLNSRNNEPWTHVWDSGAFCFRIVIQTIYKQVYSIQYTSLHWRNDYIMHFLLFMAMTKLSSWVTKIQDAFCPILDYLLLQLTQG